MLPAVYSVVAFTGLVMQATPFPHYDPPPDQYPYGYLWTYKQDGQGKSVRVVEKYVPREGDLVFFDDQSEWWRFLYSIASTAPPFHAGIVIKKPDGDLAVLESGPDDTLHVYILDIVSRLHTFKGILQIRRCKKALTPEQSATLTAFAKAQEGKRYAMWRLLLQGTAVKTRGGPWRESLAKTHFDRKRWLCAEIVVTAAALVGLMDHHVIKGTNTYPLDIIDDHKFELLPVFEEFGYWSPHPEVR